MKTQTYLIIHSRGQCHVTGETKALAQAFFESVSPGCVVQEIIQWGHGTGRN